MSENKMLRLLGIAAKAGKLASGEFAAGQALKARKAWLTIVAEDASANTKKKFRDRCEHGGCPLLVIGSKQALAHAIGKGDRSCIAVLDQGLSESILRAIRESGKQYGENENL